MGLLGAFLVPGASREDLYNVQAPLQTHPKKKPKPYTLHDACVCMFLVLLHDNIIHCMLTVPCVRQKLYGVEGSRLPGAQAEEVDCGMRV